MLKPATPHKIRDKLTHMETFRHLPKTELQDNIRLAKFKEVKMVSLEVIRRQEWDPHRLHKTEPKEDNNHLSKEVLRLIA
jgi:hypothetical protein